MARRNDAGEDCGGTAEAACGCAEHPGRRAVGLLLAGGVAAAVAGRGARADDADPALTPPQPGDVLVHANGDHRGDPVRAADVTGEEAVVQAWARDPKRGTVRSLSRLNRVLLLRLKPETLDPDTAKRAADGGIVAYSDFCTHAGCWIETYRVAEGVIYCHCHGSMFDPKAGAKVVGGPARRPLAGLPVKVDGGQLVVAGAFTGPLGMPKAASFG